jgi:hypothetical protein
VQYWEKNKSNPGTLEDQEATFSRGAEISFSEGRGISLSAVLGFRDPDPVLVIIFTSNCFQKDVLNQFLEKLS